jgi:transcriptional regulator with XRE-family HTH domain
MNFSSSFGYWVRRRRKALDLTQANLAHKVGCALITIKKIESDERRPSLQMAQRLAESLNLSPKERTYFIQAARGELAAFRLSLSERPIDSLLQSGLVTFLLVDIQVSAALWEKYPQVMREALPWYSETFNKIVESQGGALFRKTAEDLCGVFATPH